MTPLLCDDTQPDLPGIVDYISDEGTSGYDRALELAGEMSSSGELCSHTMA
jgi:hypothetical protein